MSIGRAAWYSPSRITRGVRIPPILEKMPNSPMPVCLGEGQYKLSRPSPNSRLQLYPSSTLREPRPSLWPHRLPRLTQPASLCSLLPYTNCL